MKDETEDLIELGTVTKDTRGVFLCGFLYDGGNGYYFPPEYPGCYDPWPH